MISKTELSGWWDHVCLRTGWSNKISKWKWVFLQITIPILIVLPFFSWMIIKFDDYSLKQAAIYLMVFFSLVALFNSGAWSRDQEKYERKRPKKQ